MSSLTIIADREIPELSTFFGDWCKVLQCSHSDFSHSLLKQADVLLTRTTTPINQDLIYGTKIKAIASATSGVDHVNLPDLQRANIPFFSAHGANALAVRDYVASTIAFLIQNNLLSQHTRRAGLIGVGKVGTLVKFFLEQLGFEVIYHDPIRAAQEPNFPHHPLHAFQNLDIICIHAALTHHGEHPSAGMIDEVFLAQQRPGAVLLNAARGEIIDQNALLQHGQHLHWCFDVWHQEPNINMEILKRCAIATPHIAGYSQRAKRNATRLVAEQLRKHFNVHNEPGKHHTVPTKLSVSAKKNWTDTVLSLFDPHTLTLQMKRHMAENTNGFTQFRQTYALRREFCEYQLQASDHLSEQDHLILSSLFYGSQETI